jgi:hypothetical protein
VELYDFGASADGEPFIVTELLDGMPWGGPQDPIALKDLRRDLAMGCA